MATISPQIEKMFVDALNDHAYNEWSQLFMAVNQKPLDKSLFANMSKRATETNRRDYALACIDALRLGFTWKDHIDSLQISCEGISETDLFAWIFEGTHTSEVWQLCHLYATTHKAIPFVFHVPSRQNDEKLHSRTSAYCLRKVTGSGRGGHLRFILSVGTANVKGKSTFLNSMFEFVPNEANDHLTSYVPFLVSNSDKSIRKQSIDIFIDQEAELGYHMLDAHGYDTRYENCECSLLSFARAMSTHCCHYIIHAHSTDLTNEGVTSNHPTPNWILQTHQEKCILVIQGTSDKVEMMKRKYPKANIFYTESLNQMNSTEQEKIKAAFKQSVSTHNQDLSFDKFSSSFCESVLSKGMATEVNRCGCLTSPITAIPTSMDSEHDVVGEVFPLADEQKAMLHSGDYKTHEVTEMMVKTVLQYSTLAYSDFLYQLQCWKSPLVGQILRDRREWLAEHVGGDESTIELTTARILELRMHLQKADLSSFHFWAEMFALQNLYPDNIILENIEVDSAYKHFFDMGYPISLIDGAGFEFQSTMEVIAQDQEKEVVSVSIIGPQSSGKSSLLNSLFGCTFKEGGGRCTRGVDMSYSKTYLHGLPDFVLVDTEGLLEVENYGTAIETEIVQMALSFSHITLVNMYYDHTLGELGPIGESLLHVFKVGLREYYKRKEAKLLSVCEKPRLVFVIRDSEKLSEKERDAIEERIKAVVAEAGEEAGVSRRMWLSVENISFLHAKISAFRLGSKDEQVGATWDLLNPSFGKQCFDFREVLVGIAQEAAFESTTSFFDWNQTCSTAWGHIHIEAQNPSTPRQTRRRIKQTIDDLSSLDFSIRTAVSHAAGTKIQTPLTSKFITVRRSSVLGEATSQPTQVLEQKVYEPITNPMEKSTMPKPDTQASESKVSQTVEITNKKSNPVVTSQSTQQHSPQRQIQARMCDVDSLVQKCRIL